MTKTVLTRKIPGFNGYFIDEVGAIYSTRRGAVKKLKPHQRLDGYCQVALYKDDKPHVRYVHRLVAETYFGPIEDGLEINHINLDKRDNRVSNLEMVSRQQNNKHKVDNNAQAKGECVGISKLKECDIISIRSSKLSARSLAKEFGVHHKSILNIRNLKTWRHVNG